MGHLFCSPNCTLEISFTVLGTEAHIGLSNTLINQGLGYIMVKSLSKI